MEESSGGREKSSRSTNSTNYTNRSSSDDDTDDDTIINDDEDCTYIWQVGMLCAIVVFILICLFHTESMSGLMTRNIPDPTTRTICMALIVACITFCVIGLSHHKLRPVCDESVQKMTHRHLKFIKVI